MIMLHYSSDLIAHPDDPFNVERVIKIYIDAGVSAHYLIGRDGTVYRLVPETKVAYHAGKGSLPWLPGRDNNLNEYSIGIEMLNVGSAHDMAMFMKPEPYQAYATRHPDWIGYTDAQYNALRLLIEQIRSRHPLIQFDRHHIIGHEEWAPSRRSDPGETFDWTKIGLPKARTN
jgi:N-acetyl-anhydromuramyl-L-alanine amidase AmpD